MLTWELKYYEHPHPIKPVPAKFIHKTKHAMKKILSFLGLILLVLSCSSLYAQDKVISGVVTSLTEKTPVTGASVSLEGTTRSVQTDADGKFSIAAAKGQILIITSVGFDLPHFPVIV